MQDAQVFLLFYLCFCFIISVPLLSKFHFPVASGTEYWYSTNKITVTCFCVVFVFFLAYCPSYSTLNFNSNECWSNTDGRVLTPMAVFIEYMYNMFLHTLQNNAQCIHYKGQIFLKLLWCQINNSREIK